MMKDPKPLNEETANELIIFKAEYGAKNTGKTFLSGRLIDP